MPTSLPNSTVLLGGWGGNGNKTYLTAEIVPGILTAPSSLSTFTNTIKYRKPPAPVFRSKVDKKQVAHSYA